MYLGQTQTFDVPVATVNQDPLATVQSNIPGLVMQAPDVLVGDPIEVPSPFPWWLLVVAAFLLMSSKKGK